MLEPKGGAAREEEGGVAKRLARLYAVNHYIVSQANPVTLAMNSFDNNPGCSLYRHDESAFRDLAQLLQQTPTLQKHAHFVLVPGPDDPSMGAPDVLPRAPLSRSACADVLSTLTNCELLSSPARRCKAAPLTG